MKSLITHILVATVPLIMLVTAITLHEMFKNHNGRRALKKLAAGAIKILPHSHHARH